MLLNDRSGWGGHTTGRAPPPNPTRLHGIWRSHSFRISSRMHAASQARKGKALELNLFHELVAPTAYGSRRPPEALDCGSLLPLSVMQPCCELDGIGILRRDYFRSSAADSRLSRGKLQQAVAVQGLSKAYPILPSRPHPPRLHLPRLSPNFAVCCCPSMKSPGRSVTPPRRRCGRACC